MSNAPLPEPVAFRTRYRSEPGMIGHYPWTYSDKQRRWTIRAELEHENLHSAAQMHAHAAAVTAAKDAEIAGLREALDEATCTVSAAMLGRDRLRAGNTALHNNVVGPLREHIKVLEDALRKAIVQNEHDMLLTGDELRAARAALGDKT